MMQSTPEPLDPAIYTPPAPGHNSNTAKDKPRLNLVVVGHVDHGKSTLIGRLLADTGSLMEGKLEQAQKASAAEGMPFEYAFLLDALLEEQHQNITIDTTRIPFRTATREYCIIDAPGHTEFLRNMVTGAAAADAALLLIDAREGVMEQSRRHALLMSLLGITQIAVLVNKMDLVSHEEAAFKHLALSCETLLASVGLKAAAILPISARHGDNLTASSARMPWWKGPSVLQTLETFEGTQSADTGPLRFCVQDIYRQEDTRLIIGRVESGCLKAGDRLVFSPTGNQSLVTEIEQWPSPSQSPGEAGTCLALRLADPIFVERGHVGAAVEHGSLEGQQFKARIFWIHKLALVPGSLLTLRLGHQEAQVEVCSIQNVIDARHLATRTFNGEGPRVERNEVAEVELRSKKPLAFDASDGPLATSRFALYLDQSPCGGGRILPGAFHRRGQTSGITANLFHVTSRVTREAREKRNGHKGLVIWLTGLSASGKTSIALELERRLFNEGKQVYLLDGDNIRHGLSAGLGFSEADRTENIRRVGEAAKLFADAGFIVITAFISPFINDRAKAEAIIGSDRFVEVHVNAPLEICSKRDPKGLYDRAIRGEIASFTGVSSPYEAPPKPSLTLNTHQLSIDDAVGLLHGYIRDLNKAAT